MTNIADLTLQSKHSAAIESEEMNLVSLLRPRVFLDGNQWCVLYGDSLMEGVAGFGASPILAVYAFNKAWRGEVPAAQPFIVLCSHPGCETPDQSGPCAYHECPRK